MKKQMVARLTLSAAALALAALPAVFAPACLSSSTAASPGADSGPASSSGGNAGGSSGGTGDDGGTGGPTGPITCLLDDMSGPATSTGGYWFTYSDRTCANTALVMANAVGTLNPVEGYPSNPVADSTGAPLTVMLPGASNPVGYREFSGGGEKVWGAGFGFNLLNNGTNPFTMCADGGACTGTPPMVDAAVGWPAPYDASAHKGVSFYARSLMATAALPTSVRIQLSDHHTDPGAGMPGAGVDAGVCNQCDNATGGPNRCANDFWQKATITSDWQQFTVLFASIATDTWTKQYAKGEFDPTTLFHVHFQLNSLVPNFDIQVACVSWVDM